jgi:hypothetical protein
MPGIGVPAVAASGILCANTLVTPQETAKLLKFELQIKLLNSRLCGDTLRLASHNSIGLLEKKRLVKREKK